MKLFIVLSLISLISADTSVTIYSSKSINDVSEKFISHEIDFYDLMQYRGNLALVTPSYLKLRNFLKYLKNFDDQDFNKAAISSVFKSLYRNKITPVVVIDYNLTNFEAIALLDDLKRAKDLNVKECVWQLGENTMEFNYGNLKKYTEDLRTLQIICDSVKKDNKFSWSVASVSTFMDDNMLFDVEGYDFGRFTSEEMVAKSTIKPRAGYNVWATVKTNSTKINDAKNPSSCDEKCLINGLSYAQILGESARKGIDVVFIESQDISSLNGNSFKQVIDKMHNALIGTRVFKVRSSKSSYDKKQSSVYAYCSKKMNGGVTLMGINYSNARERINSKLSTSIIESNSIVLQYTLSIADGNVMVNNEKYNGTISPVYKFKKNTKFSTDFTIPPYSIAFWILKNANEKECLKSVEKNKVRTRSTIMSSSDDLLKSLAANAFRKENGKSHRSKRQISSVSPFLPKIDLKFSNLVPSNINQRSIKDVFFNNKNTEVYKVAPVESNPLQSSENPALPSGDVYLLVDDGIINDYVDAEIQYPTVNKNAPKQQLQKSNKKLYRQNSVQKADMPHEYVSSYDYIESTHKASKKNQKPKKPAPQQKNAEELFEFENFSVDYPKNHDQMKTPNNNVEIKTIARELEPTYRQSKKAIIAAKRKWDQNQLMQLLKDATLQEIDRSQIHDANEFQIIDLSNNEDSPFDYEEYEDNDEDGFFSDDRQKIRTRRSIDYSKNEISRSLNEFQEDNASESIEDVHLYHYPRNQDIKLQQSFTSTSTQATTIKVDDNSPLGVKVIDVFSKSIEDVVSTVHKNLISWWYVFSPQNEE